MGVAPKKLTQAARRMVGGHDDGAEATQALAALGLKPDKQLGDADLELWSDNVATVAVFGDMMTQWNIGPGGVVGLRYEALRALPSFRRIPAADRDDVFGGLRVMENAALAVFREQ